MLLLYTKIHCYVYRGEVAAKRPCGPLVYCHLNELTQRRQRGRMGKDVVFTTTLIAGS